MYLGGIGIKGDKLSTSLRASSSVLTIWLKQKYRPQAETSSYALIWTSAKNLTSTYANTPFSYICAAPVTNTISSNSNQNKNIGKYFLRTWNKITGRNFLNFFQNFNPKQYISHIGPRFFFWTLAHLGPLSQNIFLLLYNSTFLHAF